MRFRSGLSGVHFKTSPHILASRSLCSALPVIRLSQCKGRWCASLCNFPHLKPRFPLSRKCSEICEKSALLVSAPLPFSVFPSPTRCPSLPQHTPFALLSVCFEPHCAGICLCINLFGPFICTRPTLHFRQAWSVQDLLVRLPWGDTWCLKPSALV